MMIDPSDRPAFLRSFLKARASLDGSDTLLSFVGNVYHLAPDGSARLIFGIEGLNAARVESSDEGYLLLSREVAVYTDLESGQLLEDWQNPAGETVSVDQLRNDPVNQRYRFDETPSFPARVYESEHHVCFAFDAVLSYPSPLTPAEFPLASAGATYHATELLQFSAPREQLMDEHPSAPCHVSWVRTSPWLPWMRMGQSPGLLLYHCHGTKLRTAEELPPTLGRYVRMHAREYLTAPAQWLEPNQTTWTRFRDETNERQRTGAVAPV